MLELLENDLARGARTDSSKFISLCDRLDRQLDALGLIDMGDSGRPLLRPLARQPRGAAALDENSPEEVRARQALLDQLDRELPQADQDELE